MIFLTTGHQTPFDRLVRTIDTWAAGRNEKVFGQIGPTEFRPANIDFVDFLDSTEFEKQLAQCRLVVSHAGTGTIIQAVLGRKPIIVFPRRASLGETRNDHQVGTAQRFAEAGHVHAAENEQQLIALLNDLASLSSGDEISAFASEQLLDRLSHFINGDSSSLASAGSI